MSWSENVFSSILLCLSLYGKSVPQCYQVVGESDFFCGRRGIFFTLPPLSLGCVMDQETTDLCQAFLKVRIRVKG
jgi:hypothetical protein